MMRKTPGTLFIAAVLGLFAAGAAFGMDDASTIPTAFGIQDWFSSASAKWQISFPYEICFANPGISAGTAGNVESELDFDRIDSPVVLVTVGAMITPPYFLRCSVRHRFDRGRKGQGHRPLRTERGNGLRVF